MDSTTNPTPCSPTIADVAALFEAVDSYANPDEHVRLQCAMLWLVAHSPAWSKLIRFEEQLVDLKDRSRLGGWESAAVDAQSRFTKLIELASVERWREWLDERGFVDDLYYYEEALSICNARLNARAKGTPFGDLVDWLSSQLADLVMNKRREQAKQDAEHETERATAVGMLVDLEDLVADIESKKGDDGEQALAINTARVAKIALELRRRHEWILGKPRLSRLLARIARLIGNEQAAEDFERQADVAEQRDALNAAERSERQDRLDAIETYREGLLALLRPVEPEEGCTPLGSLIRAGRRRAKITRQEAALMMRMSTYRMARWERKITEITPNAARLIRSTGIPAERALDALMRPALMGCDS